MNAMSYLSYLMGADHIEDADLMMLDIEIGAKMEDGDRLLNIPESSLPRYIEFLREKLSKGFWNEIVGEKEIIFIFKFKDGHVEEYRLLPESEETIASLCAEFAHEPEGKTDNLYRYLSENRFYHDFMVEHYAARIVA